MPEPMDGKVKTLQRPARESASRKAPPPPQERSEDSNAESVVLSVRMTRKDLELLDLVAGLYGKTKTEMAREAIMKEVHELSRREAMEDQAERYKQELIKEYDKISSRLTELADA